MPSGRLVEASKLFYLPHAHAIISGRGDLSFLGCVLQASNGQGVRFDALGDRFAALLRSTWEEFARLTSRPPGDSFVALAGWSEREQRCAVRCFEGAAETYVELPRQDCWFSPHAPELEHLTRDAARTVAGMAKLADAQVLHMRQEFGPNAPCGGRLIVAQLTREAVTISTVCDLEAIAAPIACQSVATGVALST